MGQDLPRISIDFPLILTFQGRTNLLLHHQHQEGYGSECQS